MVDINEKFKPNYENAISNPSAVFKGSNYRITVLSEILFQDANLKVTLNGTDKEWYYGHDESRNFGAYINNIDTRSPYLTQAEKMLEEKNKSKKLLKKIESFKGLYSTDGFASIDDSKSLIIDEKGYLIRDDRQRIDIYLFMYKRSFGKCLNDYFKLSGYPPLIPRYSLGIWWNKTKPYSLKDIQELVQKFNKYQIPLSVLLLGQNWHIKDSNNMQLYKSGFTFNPEYFSKPEELTTYLHDRGIKLGLNIDPGEGIHTHERNYDELASDLGIKEKQIIPFNVLEKRFISAYLNRLITPLYNNGVDFFWVDYYPKERKKLNILNYYQFNDFKRMTNVRPLIISRLADVAPHNYGIHYSGETLVSWDTLDKLPEVNSSGSNLGLSWWSHDIGGYKNGMENSDLYLRYVQLGTFSPIFRLSSEEGHYYKRVPWKWDIKTFTIVKDYCLLRHRLIPYIYGEAYKYHKSGLPLIQPLYYLIPEIYDEVEFKNEYFFGTELLVAPITKPKDSIMNRSVKRIYLPPGTWYDFKTGKRFIGDKRYYLFYKDEDYPVFAKSGSIICLADLEENINTTNPPKTLEVHVFPGKSNIYNLYEDDGVSSLYEDGYYIVTRFDYNYLENNYNLIIRPFEGKSKIIPDRRNYRIRFRNTREPRDVIVKQDNDDIAFTTRVEENDLIIEVNDVDTTKQIIVICKGQNINIDSQRIINEDIDFIINDLQLKTALKEKIAEIMFSKLEVSKKRIQIKRLKNLGLEQVYIKMFLKLLDYIKEV